MRADRVPLVGADPEMIEAFVGEDVEVSVTRSRPSPPAALARAVERPPNPSNTGFLHDDAGALPACFLLVGIGFGAGLRHDGPVFSKQLDRIELQCREAGEARRQLRWLGEVVGPQLFGGVGVDTDLFDVARIRLTRPEREPVQHMQRVPIGRIYGRREREARQRREGERTEEAPAAEAARSDGASDQPADRQSRSLSCAMALTSPRVHR